LELDLQVIDIKPCTKYKWNSCAHSGKQSGKLCGRTDRQTRIKPIVPSGYTGRGLIMKWF
jgi:hypothetical protein